MRVGIAPNILLKKGQKYGLCRIFNTKINKKQEARVKKC